MDDGPKLEKHLESLTEEDVTFTVQQFMQYLANVGRSNKCPVCPHQGEWIFHTTLADTDRLLVHIIQNASATQEYTPVSTMECPRCGFISQTSLIAVAKHFKVLGDGR